MRVPGAQPPGMVGGRESCRLSRRPLREVRIDAASHQTGHEPGIVHPGARVDATVAIDQPRRLLAGRSRSVSVFDKRHREVIARVAFRSATARGRAVSEVVTQGARAPPRTYWVAAHRARIFCRGRQPLHRKYAYYTRGGNAATLPPGDALHDRSVVARLSVRPATRDISLPRASPANSCRKHGDDIG